MQILFHFLITLAFSIRLLNKTYGIEQKFSLLLELILEEVNITGLEGANKQWKLQWNLLPGHGFPQILMYHNSLFLCLCHCQAPLDILLSFSHGSEEIKYLILECYLCSTGEPWGMLHLPGRFLFLEKRMTFSTNGTFCPCYIFWECFLDILWQQ